MLWHVSLISLSTSSARIRKFLLDSVSFRRSMTSGWGLGPHSGFSLSNEMLTLRVIHESEPFDFFFPLLQFTVTQIICFLLAIFGTAILLEHSTYNSRVQPMIRHTMNQLIMKSEYQPAQDWLRLIQESVSTHQDPVFIPSSNGLFEYH